jgi:outer membrane lipase/esterase
VLELYRQYPALSEETLIAEARARGRRLALVVNRLVGLGVKVIISDLPDMGMTPYALAERALGGSGGFDRAALISRLTVAFNEQLGVNIVLDGRFVGLVQAQLRFEAIARFPASFGLANIWQPICTVALPECTTATLLPGAVTGQFLWADDTRLAPGGHAQLATLAADRAQRNPF